MKTQQIFKTYETKRGQGRLAKKLSVIEIMSKYKGLSRTAIYRWVRLYRKEIELENANQTSGSWINLHFKCN